jgi:biopolymer transport protein ExbD
MKRMARNRPKVAAIPLTSLMDVFTTLVFFLVLNQGATEVLNTPNQITLPDSAAEEKPRETVVVFVSSEEVTVQGEAVVRVSDILASDRQDIQPIAQRLAALNESIIGFKTQVVAESKEVTILADKSVPFSVVKKVMSTCTSQGYARISLAVMQKESEASQTAMQSQAGKSQI